MGSRGSRATAIHTCHPECALAKYDIPPREVHAPILVPGEEEFNFESLGPITSFHYQMHHPREASSFRTETAALATILEKLCETLESLALMTESAPLSVMANLKWPRPDVRDDTPLALTALLVPSAPSAVSAATILRTDLRVYRSACSLRLRCYPSYGGVACSRWST